MHKTILIEEITIENVTEKINEKVQEMEKDGYRCIGCIASLRN